MTSFAPKIYQSQVLECIETYFKACHELPSPSIAFTATTERLWGRGNAYNPLSGFPADMPYFCLRVPTGGGKTWLAAKKALADYKKAVGTPAGLAELMVFYCERASGFSCDVGLQDEVYFDALVRMFEQALKVIATLPEAQRSELWSRLDEVRWMSHNFGYGVGDEMADLLAEHGVDG